MYENRILYMQIIRQFSVFSLSLIISLFYNLIRYNRLEMQGQTNKSKDDGQLPKIRSQRRISTADDRRIAEDDTALANRPLSNNCRTRSLRAFTSKTVKYEVAGNVYNKKIEQIQRQNLIVDGQMKQVQEQINQLRQAKGNAKKQPGASRLNESSASYLSRISSRKICLTDGQSIKAELKNLQARILNSRSKIDTHLQKNKAIQQEIDAYRKQVSTLKNINQQLFVSFKKTSVLYQEQMQLSRKLDAQIAGKNQLTHRKKVENLHQKAQMIKQYDVILKTLDNQLNNDKTGNEEQKSQFYLTDIATQPLENELARKKSNQKQKQKRHANSVKRPRINEINQKLKRYQKQFQELKQKVGSGNIEEITKRFTQEYQNNFHQYNFINQMYQEYEQVNMEQFQLLQKKNQLLKQLQAQKSECKVKEIHQFKDSVKRIEKKKDKIKKDLLLYDKIALQLKMYLGQYFNTLEISLEQKNRLVSELTEKRIAWHLNQIYEKHSESFSFSLTESGRGKKLTKNNFISDRQNIQDLIEQVKKQGQASKDNRLLSRQELQKNTIQLKQRKTEASLTNQFRLKGKKQIQKSRSQNVNKKINR